MPATDLAVKLRLIPLGVLLLAAAGSAQTSENPASPGPTAATDPAAAPAAAASPANGDGATSATSAATPALASAQPEKRVVPNGRLPEVKRTDRGKYGRIILPDVDLLDGSSYEKEKRPLRGMISEIELGETDGGPQSKVSPESGPSGAGKEPPEPVDPKTGGASSPQNVAQTPAAAGAAEAPTPNTAQGGGGAGQQIPEGQVAGGGGAQSPDGQVKPGGAGPAAAAEGVQAASLQVPEGAAGAVGSASAKPQNMQIGDASLQIQSTQNSSDVVGTQASTAQQYDRKTPAGSSSVQSSGNVGVEKGRVVPKGL